MQKLYHNKITEAIGNSTTMKTISRETYDKFLIERHFKIKNKVDVSDYINDKITNVTYSLKESESDIVKKLEKQCVLQKYHCMEIAVAVLKELFSNYIIDVISKCCGMMLYYNNIPVICLVNSDIGGNLVLTVNLFHVETDFNKRCQEVSQYTEKAMRKNIITESKTDSYIREILVIGTMTAGLCALISLFLYKK